MKPDISVITTVFNCAKYIEESIDSISNQTYAGFEHIIVNDGSTDGTDEIIKRKSESDKRIIFINTEFNIGRVKSLNLGLERSSGKYIAIQDADDISLPQRFEKQVSFFNKNPDHVLLGSDVSVIDQKGSVVSQPVRPVKDIEIRFSLLFKCTLANPSVMFRKDILDMNNIRYEEDFVYAEDFRIYTKISKYGKIHNLKDKLVLYRDHPVNSSSRNVKIIAHDSAKVVVDNFKEYNIEITVEDAVRIRKLISSKGFDDKYLLQDMKSIFELIKAYQGEYGSERNEEALKLLKRMIKWPGKKKVLLKPYFSRLQFSILKYYIKQAKLGI